MSKIKYIFWTIASISFGIFLVAFLLQGTEFLKLNTGRGMQSASALNSSADLLSEKEIPQYRYLTEEPRAELKISAEAYLVGDLDTGEVILSKNERKKLPIASVSKLMTAYVSKELSGENDIAIVSKKSLDTYGKNGNLKIGEKIKVSDLFYPLLLESSNDAAEVLAEHFDRDTFLSKMNQMAKNLELSETFFDDPSGLSEKNQSTVFDLFKLSGYIRQKAKDLFEITTQRSYSTKIHNWSNNNQFLKEDGYLGGKSGYTDPALQTVVSLFAIPLSESDTRNIGITLLHSKDRYKDVESILKYLEKNIYYGGVADAQKSWVKVKAGIPDIKDPDFVNLVFGGDIMLDRGVRSSVNKNFGGDYSALFEKMDILKKADIAFANLEGPVSDKGKDKKNLYSFRMDPAVIPALKGAGIDVVSVANNHVGDWGREAYTDTLERLEENEIKYAGGGITKVQAEEPVVIEKYGIKVGYIGFSDVGPNWMSATETQSGLLLANNPRFEEIIQNASKKVDYLVVSFHFGDEYKDKHNTRQEYLAHKAIDAGAKIIIGHHPHVVEDTEVYRNGFIAYSLGNFIFDQGFSKDTMQGMLLEVKLNRDGSMSVKKDMVVLNKSFQPEKIIYGKEENVGFEEIVQ